jgi:hypothetical protein
MCEQGMITRLPKILERKDEIVADYCLWAVVDHYAMSTLRVLDGPSLLKYLLTCPYTNTSHPYASDCNAFHDSIDPNDTEKLGEVC